MSHPKDMVVQAHDGQSQRNKNNPNFSSILEGHRSTLLGTRNTSGREAMTCEGDVMKLGVSNSVDGTFTRKLKSKIN